MSKKPPVPPPALPEALDALFAPWDRSDAPGLVVGVAHGGKVVYRRGLGMASLEHGVANTPATRMRIGSTSKHFACLAALLLAEEGRLDIDVPASRWLPELPRAAGMPTLRQFMNHTSGLRDYVDLIALTAAGVQQPPGCGLGMQARQRSANFAPGASQLYCNGGYHLLSIVVERVAGMPFERFLHERIFAPLRMADTASIPSDLQITPGMATLHAPQPGGGWRRGLFITEEIRGEGAIVSTVDDMLTWLAHLREPTRVGSAGTWRRMAERPTLADGSTSVYGMGLYRFKRRGLEVVSHSGAVIGGLCQMLTVPAHALDVIIMTNGAQVSPIELGWQVMDIVLQAHVSGPATPRRPAARRYAALLGTRWASPQGHVFGFADVGGQLAISGAGPVAVPLLRDEGARLRIGFEDLAAGPFVWPVAALRPGAKAPPRRIEMSDAGNPVLLTRLPRRAPALAGVAARLAGRYVCPELDAQAELKMEGDEFVLAIVGSYGSLRMGVTPMTGDLLHLRVLDPRSGGDHSAQVETRGGRVTGLLVTTLRTRQLRFEKRR